MVLLVVQDKLFLVADSHFSVLSNRIFAVVVVNAMCVKLVLLVGMIFLMHVIVVDLIHLASVINIY
jgi:hypothetical protein